jgi:hypothetical protein
MESMGVGAGYGKIGFLSCVETNPVLIFLQQNTIHVSNKHQTTDNVYSGDETSTETVDSYCYNGMDSCDIGPTPPVKSSVWSSTENGSVTCGDGCNEVITWNLTNDPSGCGGGELIQSDCSSPVAGTCGDYWGILADYGLGDSTWATVIDVCSPTYQETKRTYTYTESDDSDIGDTSDITENDMTDDIIIWSRPFTDAMLRQKIISLMPSWPASFYTGSSMAYYDLDVPHINGSGGKMRYYVQVPDSEKNITYTAQWNEITGYYDKTNTTVVPMQEDIQGTGDPVNPAQGKIHFVDMPGSHCYIYETAPDIIATKSATPSGPGSSPGNGGPSGGSGWSQ